MFIIIIKQLGRAGNQKHIKTIPCLLHIPPIFQRLIWLQYSKKETHLDKLFMLIMSLSVNTPLPNHHLVQQRARKHGVLLVLPALQVQVSPVLQVLSVLLVARLVLQVLLLAHFQVAQVALLLAVVLQAPFQAHLLVLPYLLLQVVLLVHHLPQVLQAVLSLVVLLQVVYQVVQVALLLVVVLQVSLQAHLQAQH